MPILNEVGAKTTTLADTASGAGRKKYLPNWANANPRTKSSPTNLPHVECLLNSGLGHPPWNF